MEGLIYGGKFTDWASLIVGGKFRGLFSEFYGMLKTIQAVLGMGERKQTIEKETPLHALSTMIYDLTKLRLLQRTD